MRALWLVVLVMAVTGPARADVGDADVGMGVGVPGLEAPRWTAVQTPAERPLGIGIQVGAPTALTLKYRLATNQALVAGVGAGFGPYGGFGASPSLHVDWLFTVAQLVRNDTLGLSAYLGPGLWLALFKGGYAFGTGYYYQPGFALFGLAARLPLGLSMAFTGAPLELYGELDPALLVFPGVDFGIGAALGFRFYF